ncbi:hypothetical protein [Clostridioides difficile]|uniref:hypothetical protein n=1 Tax=Clostridioides difficile TaxID=1496 RepID=UPI002FE6361B
MKVKSGFSTKKDTIAFEQNFSVKISGSLTCYLKIYMNFISLYSKIKYLDDKRTYDKHENIAFFEKMKVNKSKPLTVKKRHNILLNIEKIYENNYKLMYLKTAESKRTIMLPDFLVKQTQIIL